MDNRVFVSLSNGELVVFSRTLSKLYFHVKRELKVEIYLTLVGGSWNFEDYVIKTVSKYPITCMLAVAGKLWCANGNSIVILSPNTLTSEVYIFYSFLTLVLLLFYFFQA
jgi:hypothetical protein